MRHKMKSSTKTQKPLIRQDKLRSPRAEEHSDWTKNLIENFKNILNQSDKKQEIKDLKNRKQ